MFIYILGVLLIFGHIQENAGAEFDFEHATRILTECMKEHTIKMDGKTKIKMVDLVNSQLCGLKCLYEREGAIKKDGTFDTDELVQALNKVFVLSDEMPACLKKIEKVEKCMDVMKIQHCLMMPV